MSGKEEKVLKRAIKHLTMDIKEQREGIKKDIKTRKALKKILD